MLPLRDYYGHMVGCVHDGIKPSGIKEIKENGAHDVTNYAVANVNVDALPPVTDLAVSDDGVVSWTAPSLTHLQKYNPTISYIVNINGTELETTEVSIDASEYIPKGETTIRVKVKAILNSEENNVIYSTTKVVTLSTTFPYDVYYADNCCASVGTNVYVFTNAGIYKYDTTNETITRIYNTQNARDALTIGNFVYVFKTRTAIRKYDATSNTITTLSTFPTRDYAYSVAAVGTDIYALGGQNSSGSWDFKIDKFDTVTETFETLTAQYKYIYMQWSKAVTVGTDIYIVGGWDSGSNYRKAIIKFDTVSQTITTYANLPYGLDAFAITVIDNNIYTFGGIKNNSSGSISDTILKIDIINNTIEELSVKLPFANFYNVACSINGDTYIIGGTNGKRSILKFTV